MNINPKLPKEEKYLAYLSIISHALQSIASTLSYEFGPMKPGKMVNPSEEAEERWKEIKESNRREEEIAELKKSNIIATRTARIAAIGIVITAVFGVLQFGLSLWEFYKK